MKPTFRAFYGKEGAFLPAARMLWQICDTFSALSRGKSKMISGMLQTWLIHNQTIKKES